MRDIFFPLGRTVGPFLLVDPAAGDDASGSKGGKPFATIAAANAAAVAGDTILLNAGIHCVAASIILTAGVRVLGMGIGATVVDWTWDGIIPAPCFQLASNVVVGEMTIMGRQHDGKLHWNSCIGQHRNILEAPALNWLVYNLDCHTCSDCFYFRLASDSQGMAVNCSFEGEWGVLSFFEGNKDIRLHNCTARTTASHIGGTFPEGVMIENNEISMGKTSEVSLYNCTLDFAPILGRKVLGFLTSPPGGGVSITRLGNCALLHSGAGTSVDLTFAGGATVSFDNTTFDCSLANIVGDGTAALQVSNWKADLTAAQLAALTDGVSGFIVNEGWLSHRTDAGPHDVISDGLGNWPDVPW